MENESDTHREINLLKNEISVLQNMVEEQEYELRESRKRSDVVDKEDTISNNMHK